MSGVNEKSWISYKRHWIPVVALGLGIATTVWWLVSPWPAALMIRALFEKGAADTVAEMLPYAPKTGIEAQLDLAYGDQADETFHLFRPTGAEGPLPTVVWIHGGAWISGTASNVDPYIQILAEQGYTTVSLNYTSQLAVITTNPSYAAEMAITPALAPDQLRAVILNCGIYDVSGIPDAPGIGGWGFRIALWAYLGEKDWSNTPGGQEMSTLDYVTADFPTTWISGGNGDPLTPSQSKPLASKLDGLGVDVTSVFYPEDHEPSLPHEYQFHLDFEDARTALQSTIDFLATVTE